MKLSAAATGALSGAAFLSTTASAQSAPTCRSGVHVIVTRASTEPQGFGVLRSVADNIVSQIPDSDSVAVEYPATLLRYPESQSQGIGNLTQLITSYGDACPGHRMALLGYSQGAHVVGDTLIGADYRELSETFPNRAPIARQYVDSVCGVIIMGDPANVANQSFLVGNSTNSGFFPRANAYEWYMTGLSSRMQSYCDHGDTYCDSGDIRSVHQSYVPVYGDAAVDFVLSQCNAANTTTPSVPRPTTGGSGGSHNSTSSAGSRSTVSGSQPAPRPTVSGSGSSPAPRPTVSGSGSRPVSRPTVSGSYAPPPPMVTGNSTSGVNQTAPGGSGNVTGTITETEPDVTPAPTSNGDQGIYTTRASSAPAATPSGPVANAASSLMAASSSGMAGYVVSLVMGGALVVALNL